MGSWLALARGIDALNQAVGRGVSWLVLAATLVSAGNAVVRYGLGLSSNAWLELQWYLFALVFLLGAGYTLKHDGHVRVDALHGRFSPNTRAWIDLLGGLFFRRMTKAASIASMITGFVVSTFWIVFVKASEAGAIGLVQRFTGGKPSLLASRPNWPVVEPIIGTTVPVPPPLAALLARPSHADPLPADPSALASVLV